MNDALRLLTVNLDYSVEHRVVEGFGLAVGEVMAVDSREAAIAALEQAAFDCALIWVDLPDATTVEFVRQIRDRAFPVAILVITEQGSEQLAVDLLQSGAHDYLSEAFSAREFARRLRDAVRVHRAEILAQEALQDLRTSEERYRLVVEGSNDGIWDWYIPQNEVICNDRMFEILGLNRAQLGTAQDGFFALIHPDDQEWVLQKMRSHLTHATPFDVEFRLRHASGTYLYCTSRGKAQRDGRGQIFRMSGIVTDISQRKADEARILQLNRELERRVSELQTLLNVIPIGIGIATDVECNNIQVNAALSSLLGISLDQNGSKNPPNGDQLPFKIYRNGTEMQPNQLPMQQCAQTGTSISGFELDVVNSVGNPVKVLAEVAPLFDELGQSRGCVGAFVDITDRKRTEEAQRFLANASTLLTTSLDSQTILASLAQLTIPDLADWCWIHLLQNNEPQLVAIHHQDASKVAAFAALCDRYPLTPSTEGISAVLKTGESQFYPAIRAKRNSEGTADVLSQFAQDLDHAEPLQSFQFSSAMIVPILARERILGTITLAYAESERCYTQHDLQLAEDLARRAALAIDNATLYQATQQVGRSLRRAITTLIRQNQAVETQKHQIAIQNIKLQEAAQIKSQFLAMMSHELRTPMNAIMGFSQLLMRQKTLTQSQAEMVTRIYDNSKNLLALINNILDLSKIEAGRLELQAQRYNVVSLLNATVEELRSLAHQKKLSLVSTSHLNDPWIVNDSSRLKQVLINLLSNAIKFTNSGGVEVSLEQQGDMIVLSVKDTGIGIAEQNLQHIFEEFRQVDQTIARRHPGTGLGLAITQSLVEMMQGKISVESELGVGSTFRVELPRQITV